MSPVQFDGRGIYYTCSLKPVDYTYFCGIEQLFPLDLQDLSMYRYDKMVTKSLDILNKLYSSQSDMFQLASKAQILLTQDSAKVHREVQRSLPVLRRLAKQKLSDQQVTLTGEILDELSG